MKLNRMLAAGAAFAVLAAVAGCGKDPAAQAARDHSGAQPSYSAPSGSARDSEVASSREDRVDHRKDAAPKAKDGKPIWSANRQHSAQENAEAAFRRNGEAFGASDLDDFVAKAHAFVGHPPKGVERLERTNGDVALYDPRNNIFAVATRDGAPRTMFKPDDGPAYWEKEKARAAQRAERSDRSDSRYDRSDRSDRKSASRRRKSRNDDES